MIYKQFVKYYKTSKNNPTASDLLKFINSYKLDKNIGEEEIYRLFENDFRFSDDYENVICPTLASKYSESIIFKLVTLGSTMDLSIFERVKELDAINKEFHSNYELSHKKLNNVLLSIYLEFISEYLLTNEYDKASYIAKELFLNKFKSKTLYNFLKYYINIFAGKYDNLEMTFSNAYIDKDFILILKYMYFIRIENFKEAIDILDEIKESNVLLYYLLGFRHVDSSIRDYKQINLKVINRLVKYYEYLEEPRIVLDNTDLFFFVAKVCENFVFCFHGWEKFNDYNRQYFLSKYDVSQEDKIAILGIDNYLKTINEPSIVYFKYLLAYLKNDEKSINEANNLTSNVTHVFTNKFLENAFKQLVASHIVDVVDEKSKVYSARNELHILADYYYQEMYMDTYNFSTPFDENNYRKDN